MKNKKQNRICGIAILTLLMVFWIVGCSSIASVEEKEKIQTTVVYEEHDEAVEAKVEITSEPTPNPTVEPTEKTTPEPTPLSYGNIDMESALPGKEWVTTFRGSIEEPKVVVFNDETNKKLIIESGAEIEFAEDDVLVIYMPDGMWISDYDGKNIEQIMTYDTSYTVVEFKEGRRPTPNNISIDFGNDDNVRVETIQFKLKAPTY